MKPHKFCHCESCEAERYCAPCAGCAGGHPSFWKTIVESEEWRLWHEELRKRWKKIHDEDCLPIFDIDESQELGCMSKEHWEEFVKFVKTI
jgi:hypothetical protein